MHPQSWTRLQLCLLGGLGATLLWWVFDTMDRRVLDEYVALALIGFVLTLTGGILAMAGPLGLLRAIPRALLLAVVAGGLVWMTHLRFDKAEQFFSTPVPALSGLIIATFPLPFLIAAGQTSWRDYPALFLEAWSIGLRLAAAIVFTWLVWLVVLLSNAVLQIVGIDVIDQIIRQDWLMFAISGAALGLGMAVIYEIAEIVSPYLLLRLLRLFLPVVLAVMVIFLLALPFRGFEGLTQTLSPTLILLVMVGSGITLVSVTIDQNDAVAVQHPVLVRSAQGVSLLLPVLAVLALWALWLRIADYGWTPGRIFVVLVALLALGYGLIYAVAVARGAGWRERIRQGNIRMVLVIIGLAVLWMTPVLNAERISAQDQLARFLDGRTQAADIRPYVLRQWGKPGAEVLARLEEMAKEPGQKALAAVLTGQTSAGAEGRADLLAQLARSIPVQPATAIDRRDAMLAAADSDRLENWARICDAPPATYGTVPCLMVLADLLPLVPGDEALLFLRQSDGYMDVTAMSLNGANEIRFHSANLTDGSYIYPEKAEELMRQFSGAVPPLTSMPLNQLGTGEDAVFINP